MFSRRQYAKIHSVFPNGFNLSIKGSLIYVSFHEAGKLSARGLTIDKQVFDRIQSNLKDGQRVRIQENQIVFYTQPTVLTVEIVDQIIKELQIKPDLVDKSGWSGLKRRLEKEDLFEMSGFSKNKSLSDTFDAIYKMKEVNANHVNQLIGAGIGLTPSGDDFLQGLVLIEKMVKHSPVIENLVQDQLKERSTTDVSLSYYDVLFDGYYNEPLAMLFEAIQDENELKIERSLALVQAYGQTSGYDLLTGILTYLQIIF